MNKLIINAATGFAQYVKLTDEEVAARDEDHLAVQAKSDARQAVAESEALRRAAHEALLDDLLVKRATEPDVPEAIEAYLRDQV